MTNPRDDVINDICTRIRKDLNSNKSVILMGDFNEGVTSKEKTNAKLQELGLINLMQERMEIPLPKHGTVKTRRLTMSICLLI